jgi:hypothetical protein
MGIATRKSVVSATLSRPSPRIGERYNPTSLPVQRSRATIAPGSQPPRIGEILMDMKIDGLRVLVTAGASGIGLATARAFAAEGARILICDIDEKALAAVAASDPELSRMVCDVADPVTVEKLFDAVAAKPGRSRCARQQRGHRGTDRRLRRSRARRLAAHDRDQPHGSVPVRAAGNPAPQGEQQSEHREPFIGGGPLRLSDAHAVCGVEVGRGRVLEIAVGRARARSASA